MGTAEIGHARPRPCARQWGAAGPRSAAARARCASAAASSLLPLLLLLAGGALAAAAGWAPVTGDNYKEPTDAGNVHTVFLTDCTAYADWQTLTLAYSWRQSGQPGPLTRIMSCTDEEAKAHKPDTLESVTTHTAPSYATAVRTGDHYAAYNKPGAIKDWLKHFSPEEEWILILEADMILRQPITPEDFNLTSPGHAVGARYEHLAGVSNQLAAQHIPEVVPRADALAGPPGRRADQVGGFMLVHRDDLRRIAPLWLKYTEDVRADPQASGSPQAWAGGSRRIMLTEPAHAAASEATRDAGDRAAARAGRRACGGVVVAEAWKYAGDTLARNQGDKPWLAEMYGYVFAAAKADVWHRWDKEAMLYPGYTPQGVVHILHYGVQWKVTPATGEPWSFDKKDFNAFDISRCPPWETGLKRPTSGLLPPPPAPSKLVKHNDSIDRYRELLALEPVLTANAALCQHYLRICRPSKQLARVCDIVDDAYQALNHKLERMDGIMACGDFLRFFAAA
ncbi:hypothetical protein MNEG_6466 [Monoraphidium neglectum]|uniref:Hydroxyproline O-arabinosyltransferase-like domain-containing protein n=1 Tax=Monoraphidium neglectum TaxID=145388 RepID=A0A0D2N6E5_9CHLO|nr:hypothetical protein MNEG_6466 [Monoraphidium neglectum]KIZ01491.1 hypothetical protein MNEG_6466 [Monoraphidium neglectum]|eukprot:XP_013900510.1 hypothetical protein MNEG_6466 [Monoraphidium neglectum]